MSKSFQSQNHEWPRSNRPANAFEMDDTNLTDERSRQDTVEVSKHHQHASGLAWHTLGLLLLLIVVFLWTFSNFLASSVLADDTYAKPFFLTYLNTSTFMLATIPTILRSAYQARQDGTFHDRIRDVFSRRRNTTTLFQLSDSDSESESFLKPDQPSLGHTAAGSASRKRRTHLGLLPTARLALVFCLLWFGANYFAASCLQYTTVASATILTSTSSIWTLLIGAFTHTEKFTWRKLCGVLASILGIVLISRVDLTAAGGGGNNNNNNNNIIDNNNQAGPILSLESRAINPFPNKSATELASGDILALLSAIIYGIYTITLKKTSLKAEPLQLNMPLFFGLVGCFNFVFLMPLFPILHWTGLETFQLPPSQRVWTILLMNSFSSLLSDICWAYAMVLTSPLVVTVGLSLTIPLSLIGEMLVQGRYEGWLYWVGAGVVVGSFLFVNHEEVKEEKEMGEAEHDAEINYGDGDQVVDIDVDDHDLLGQLQNRELLDQEEEEEEEEEEDHDDDNILPHR